MADNKQQTAAGMGLLGWLTLCFIVMKLAGIGEVAKWSWWGVFSPIWIPLALAAIAALTAIIVTIFKN
jgi:hypothetical protein